LAQPPDCFYGVPEGATKLAIITQYKWAKSRPSFGPGSHVVPMGRAKPKDHGVPKDKFFVGAPRGLTIVLEDVTTTGGSLLGSIDGLVESDIPVAAAFGLTNRMEKRDDGQSVAQAIAAKASNRGPIRYLHLSNAIELLPLAVQRFSPPAAVIEAIVEEFKKYGEEPIEL